MLIEAVAHRVLHCQLEGRKEEVTVRLGPPQQEEDNFLCEYQILIGGASKVYAIRGYDGVQALQLAMFMVGSTLQSMQGASNWSWNDQPSTGFPTSLDQPIGGLRRD